MKNSYIKKLIDKYVHAQSPEEFQKIGELVCYSHWDGFDYMSVQDIKGKEQELLGDN